MYQSHPVDVRLASVLPPGTLFAVGGRVRDEIRAEIERVPVEAHDLDYVVVGVPDVDLRRLLATLGPVDIVGASFSVFKLRLDGEMVDVALPRRERSSGPHHRDFDVQSGPDIPLEDDLARRDFRMNMLARAVPSGQLVDPYGGVEDIREARIDILAEKSFQDDPLRMLRAAQFAARFGYSLTPRTLAAMHESATLTKTLSEQRIREELSKLLTLSATPSIGFELLKTTGLLAEIWPELLEGVGVEQNEFHAHDVWGHAMRTLDATPKGDLTLRLAALFHDVGKPRTKDGPHFYGHERVGAALASDMLNRTRFSGALADDVVSLIQQHMYSTDPIQTDAAVRRFLRRVTVPRLQWQFALRHADIVGSGLPPRGDWNARFEARVERELAQNHALGLADLAIRGRDVIETMIERGIVEPGFQGDQRVGAALSWLLEQVTDAPERNETSALRALLSFYLEQT